MDDFGIQGTYRFTAPNNNYKMESTTFLRFGAYNLHNQYYNISYVSKRPNFKSLGLGEDLRKDRVSI